MKKEKKIKWERDIEGFAAHLRERENADATVEKYVRDIRTFQRYMNGRRSVNKEYLLEYKAWLMRNYRVRSVNSMLVALNQFLIYLEAGWMRIKRVKVQGSGFNV